MSTHTIFGETLRKMRGKVSQAKLADRAGLNSSFITRLEGGTRDPSRQTVTIICDALHLGPTDREELMRSAGFAGEMDQSATSIAAAVEELQSSWNHLQKGLSILGVNTVSA